MSFSGTKGYITKPKVGVMLNPLHPLSRGLIGYWLFNEGSGSSVNDISGYGNHGTLKNMSVNAQNSGWAGSKFGGDLKFDGINDYVDIGIPTGWSNSEGTFSMWVKTNFGYNVATHQTIWSMYTNNDNRVYCAYDSNEDCWIFLAEPPTKIVFAQSSVQNFTAGTLIHLTTAWNSSGKYIYVNGVLEGTQSDTLSQTITNLKIGTNWYNSVQDTPFNGLINPALYNRMLSAAEVKQLYQDPFCNLLQIPIRRHYIPTVRVIMNQFQKANIGADLYNGVFA